MRSRNGRLALGAGVVLLVVVAVLVVRAIERREGPDAKPLPGATLKARAGERYVGTAVDALALAREPGYKQVLGEEFSAVTPENAMKWAVVEPKDGTTAYGDADAIVDFARAHGQRVRGHTLVWYAQNPKWVAKLRGAELERKLRRHVDGVVRHFAGRVADWDVVNEAVGDDGGLRRWQLLTALGSSYIADAFRWAHAADPSARLWINEIGAESIGRKSNRLYALVKSLRAQGVPVDGVGFQGHFTESDGVPDSFRANLERFAALGVKLALTELDVAVKLPATAAKLRRQGEVYATAVGDCRAVSACVGITVWGFTDRHSWISATQPGNGAATLLDDELAPKPAYRAFADALGAG